MTGLVLAVLHQRDSTPGRIGEALAERGYAIDRRCPCIGDPLPGDLERYAAVVIFGGPQSATDDHNPGIRAELDWIDRKVLPGATPTLGICLGAQQIARVLGADVGPHPDGLVEIGYTEVHPTGACERFLPAPLHFYQWHRETFTIPGDAVHLAGNEAFPGQAFRYRAHVHAIEFHPEMTREMVDLWAGSDETSSRLELPGAQPREAQLECFERHAPESDRWLGRFLDDFLPQAG